MKPDFLLWTDLETTGVDEEVDAIIEIACILTDLDLSEIGQFHHVVYPDGEEGERALGRLVRTPAVWNMHFQNGLLREITARKGLPPGTVAGKVIDWLKDLGVRPHKVLLAGSGVSHFDRRFIKWHMLRLHQYLAHPMIDIGITRRQMQMAGVEVPPFNEGKDHRAMVDIRCHLMEARWMRQFFMTANRLIAEEEV